MFRLPACYINQVLDARTCTLQVFRGQRQMGVPARTASLRPRMCAPRRLSTSPHVVGRGSVTVAAKPCLKRLQQHLVTGMGQVSIAIKKASHRLADVFVDSTFHFSNIPLRPTESNFAPVAEIGELVEIFEIEGEVPEDFPEGVYIRNGANPLFGALHSVDSVLGRSSEIWVEGEGMLHALYFAKNRTTATWSVSYTNRYVQTDTLRLQESRKRRCFLPATDGDPAAMLAAFALNYVRFGRVLKNYSNTSVFEHAGRVFSAAENDMPHEIGVDAALRTCGVWDAGGDWGRPVTAHPKTAPGSGELVIFGVDVKKPFLMVGVVSADGKRLKHKVDLKLERCIVSHDIGVTPMYSIILDMPLTLSISRLIRGGPLIEFEKESHARIGVMPRYGDADSVMWFQVEPFCAFHLVNCFEDADEVVVRGFQVPGSVILGPRAGTNEEYFSRLYQWRLNLNTRTVTGRYLTGTDAAMEFPVMNNEYSGLDHRYAYVQVVDSLASNAGGDGVVLPQFGGLAKLCLKELESDDLIRVEHHQLGSNQFCSGATFVPKEGGVQEDDGWIISFVHDEEKNVSQAHIIDARKFQSYPIAKITLPQRVPYGFHGAFIRKRT